LALPSRGDSPASSDLCGTLIITDFVLDHNLSCSGFALVVGASNIVVNLNGHTISGPGSFGIAMSGKVGVSILGPGRITDYRTGINIFGSQDVSVAGLIISGSSVAAIRISGSRNVWIEDNLILNSGSGVEISSVLIQSTGNIVVSNVLFRNHAGIKFVGGIVSTTGNTIESNLIMKNTCGVLGPHAGNTIVDNRFLRNGSDFC